MKDNSRDNKAAVDCSVILPMNVEEVDMKRLMPEYSDIPDEFKRPNGKWKDLIDQWFFIGLHEDTEFEPREGIDPSKALRHISAIMRSFEPKHAHKIAACSYLMSLWFDDFKMPET